MESSSQTRLPKPTIDRDTDNRAVYQLRFDMPWITGLWASIFKAGAGGHSWPDGLPMPQLETSRIEARGLSFAQIEPFIEQLRRRVDSTDREVERQRPGREAEEQQHADEAHRLDEEFANARGLIDSLFD